MVMLTYVGDPDSGQEIDISIRLDQMHLWEDATHFAGQGGQHFDRTERERGRY